MSWQLDEALKLVRSLQPETRKYGYHLCLAGGVLNKGTSDKDLDLLFAPLDNGKGSDPHGLMVYLEVLWGSSWDFNTPDENITGIPTRNATPFAQPILPEYEHDPNNTVYQYKRKFFFDGTERIDVFIMKPAEEAIPATESWDLETPGPSQPPTDNGIFRAAVPPAIGSIQWVGEDGSFPRADSPTTSSFGPNTVANQPGRYNYVNWRDAARVQMVQEQERIARATRLREAELEREQRSRGVRDAFAAYERQHILREEARLLRNYDVYYNTPANPLGAPAQPPANTAPQVTLTPAGEAQLNPPAQPANWEASPNREHLPSTPPAEEDDYFDADDFDYDYDDDSN